VYGIQKEAIWNQWQIREKHNEIYSY
jgi:hypothetical protein